MPPAIETVPSLPATTVRAWLNDTDEVALLDVREAGQFGEAHPFFAVPAPYSRLEIDVPRLIPRRDTRVVLIDDGDGVAGRAARRLAVLGYTAVHALEGGAAGWRAAGYTLFQGVNVPSKTFGELAEHACGTPHLSAATLADWLERRAPLVLLDGRTFGEHRKMTIPGAQSVPNGELPRHWRSLAPDATTPIVIHCAGRTRSIIGAQILRSLGIPNPVLALENGTQGWALAGLALEHGSTRRPADPPAASDEDRAAAARFAAEAGAGHLDRDQAQAWLDEPGRTTYVLDVRPAEAFAAGSLTGAGHAPGGQLLQATDQTLGVRKARVILIDDDAVRAPVIAGWLSRLGWQTATVDGGIHADLRLPTGADTAAGTPTVEQAPAHIPAIALPAFLASQSPRLLDLQPSMRYRQRHASGAKWTIRPRLDTLDLAADRPLLLIVDEPAVAMLAAVDLVEAGHGPIAWTRLDDWVQAGLPTEASPAQPGDAEAIDYLFFVHDRHDGNLDAARRYLSWETGLIAQCAPDELAGFRLPGDAGLPDAAPDVGATDDRRRPVVEATLADIRRLIADGRADRADRADHVDRQDSPGDEPGPDRNTLAKIARRLETLAARTDLFGRADFPPPAQAEGVGASTRYRLNPDDGDDGLALYLNSINPGKTTAPHNHTTWAVIVAVEGQELNRLYDRLDDGRDPTRASIRQSREVTVEPGTPIAFLPDDLHSIHVVGDQPTLHFHLYGRPLETLSGRIAVDPETGAVKNYNAAYFRPSEPVR